MPAKNKLLQTTKSNAKSKAKGRVKDPKTPDEYLDAADEYEQAGGKWRQGDAAKATRFFRRAIDCYEQGLNKFPDNYDLAYNKAHLQLEICQNPRIVAEMGDNLPLLEETLESHRYALRLDPSSTHAQFNTGQTLTLLSGAVMEADADHENKLTKTRAIDLLQDAIKLFQACLETQMQQYLKNTAALASTPVLSEDDTQAQPDQQPRIAQSQNNERMGMLSRASSPNEEWVHVEESLTPNTILDTCTAELEALEELFSLNDPLHGPVDRFFINALAKLGSQITDSIMPKVLALLDDSPFQEAMDEPTGPTLSITSPGNETKAEPTSKEAVILGKAKFIAATTDYFYRSGDTNTSQYFKVLGEQFAPLVARPDSNHALPAYLHALTASADVLVTFALTVKEVLEAGKVIIPPDPELPTPNDLQMAQWRALTQVQVMYGQYCDEPNSKAEPSSLMTAYLDRGDVELVRIRLASLPDGAISWANGRETLIRNAGIYYRGAQKLAEMVGDATSWNNAHAKNIITDVMQKMLTGEPIKSDEKQLWNSYSEALTQVLKTIHVEGTLPKEMVNQLISILSLDRRRIVGEE